MLVLVGRSVRAICCALICVALIGAPAIHCCTGEPQVSSDAAPAPETAPPPPRPAALMPLYISFINLQALDVASTYRVLYAGGREANPVAARVVNSPAALIAFKAGTSAGIIAATERLRKHSPKAALIVMAALNSVMTTIVVHNYSVAARMRRE